MRGRSKRARSVALAGAFAGALGWSPAADAHRLDEYLQATRIALSPDRIRLEIDLTPGVIVAPSVLDAIDADRDMHISAAEADAYAAQVVKQLGSAPGRRIPTPDARTP